MAQGRLSTLRMLPAYAAAEQAVVARRRFAGSTVKAADELLTPRGVGQLLDGACDVLAARFAACVGIGLALWLPALIGQSLLFSWGQEELLLVWQGGSAFLVQVFAVVFVCNIAGGHLQGRDVSLLQAVRAGLPRLPGMFVIAIITTTLTVAGTCACYIPGLLVQWLFSVVPAVYVLEGPGFGEAISRGVKLVSTGPALLRWFGWFVVSNAMLAPFTAAAELLQIVPVRQELERILALPGVPFDVLAALIGSPFRGLATAYTAVLVTVFYVDQRVRREGLDLRLRLERLRATSRISAGAEGGAE